MNELVVAQHVVDLHMSRAVVVSPLKNFAVLLKFEEFPPIALMRLLRNERKADPASHAYSLRTDCRGEGLTEPRNLPVLVKL